MVRLARAVAMCLAVAPLLVFQSAEAAAPHPPNLVWIIADDMSPDTGAYGCAGVQTPHLDRLAAEGTRFTRAYASAPVCSSSRSAFILGCYQTTTGLHAHDVENPQPLPTPYRHLPGLLRDAGWFVTNTGAPGDAPRKRKAKTHYNFAHDPKEMFDGDDWRQRASGQPFFAQFQITQPHRAFPIPAVFDEAALRELRIPANYPDHPLVRRDWFAYLRSVEDVDRRVGLIIDELRAGGALDNTVIIFFADHGRPMPWGKQWLTVEGLQVPLIMRGPGIARRSVEQDLVSLIDLAPTALRLAGLSIPSWMEGASIMGSSFPKRSHIFAARDRCGDAGDRIRAVISGTHLMVRHFHPELPFLNWSSYKEAGYPAMPLLRELHRTGRLTETASRYLQPHRPQVELFDLRSDPAGVQDVAAHPDSKDLVASFKQMLDQWITASGDRGALPDPPTEPTLAEIKSAKRLDYQNAWQKRGLPAEPTDAQRLAWWMQTYRLTESEEPR